jgi:F-type H+-transporting ATPase subunit c
MDLAPIGAGIAVLSILGPALAIGILAGMSSSAIGRNPDAAAPIRSLAVVMAAFAEGLGVIALVVGLLIALL